MQYKYKIIIVNVADTTELEEVMNKHGKSGIRTIKVEYIGTKMINDVLHSRYTLYLEEKIKKIK